MPCKLSDKLEISYKKYVGELSDWIVMGNRYRIPHRAVAANRNRLLCGTRKECDVI
jgi:hypothetical protein